MQNTISKKKYALLSWRKRNRLNLQTAALGLGTIAPFVLLFSLQSEQTTPAGIGFALMVVGFTITAWKGQ